MSQNMLPIRFHSLPLNSVRHREVSNLTMDMCERHNSICTIFTTSRSFNDFYTALERIKRTSQIIHPYWLSPECLDFWPQASGLNSPEAG